MTFDPVYLREMFRFVSWGDDRQLTAAGKVDEYAYYAGRGISHGSLHAVLVHMMSTQWTWLSRYRGESPGRMLDATDYPTRQALVDHWPVVHAAVDSFLADQTPGSLWQVVTYQNTRGESYQMPLGVLVQHMIDQGTYHRGQANTLIKLSGGRPPAIYFLEWSATK